MFKKIMIPVDLAHRDAIEPALTAASDLACHHGAEVCYGGETATHTDVSVSLVQPPAGKR